MGRPKIADRSAVRGSIVTLKLTEAERAQLDALVRQRANELEQVTGQRIDLSASAFIRWLLDDRARKAMPAGYQSRKRATVRNAAATKK